MRRLRVGVVGAGIGASHIEAYQALPDMYEVATLCDIDAVRCAAVARRFAIPATIRPARAGCSSSTSTSSTSARLPGLHQTQAIAALEAGFHVVVEKPVARSLAEVDAIAAAEAASGRRVCPIFQYRFGHGVQKLHHLIAKGVAGRPSVATAETHWFRGAAYYAAASWRGTFDGELGGCLTTHAIHIHDILCEVLGPIASVHARTSNRLNRNETEDMAVLSLAFENGAFATSSVTLGSRQETSRLRFCFDELVAESGLCALQPRPRPLDLPERRPGRRPAASPRRSRTSSRCPSASSASSTACTPPSPAAAPLPVTLTDARRSIELLTAAYYSALTGEAVRPAAPAATIPSTAAGSKP